MGADAILVVGSPMGIRRRVGKRSAAGASGTDGYRVGGTGAD